MHRTIAVLSVVGLSAAAGAQFIDQEQPVAAGYMAGFSQTDLAQSFQSQDYDVIVGAGIFLQPGIGDTDTVRISLWDNLPNQGGNMLAEASDVGTQGEWFDVFWSPTAITTDTTYYLVFDGNDTLGIAGQSGNVYPHGHLFANAGYQSFPSLDYAFRTWVPSPGAAALLGLGGVVAARRRR